MKIIKEEYYDLSSVFSAIRSIKNHPDCKIIREIFKVMFHAGGNKNDITFFTGDTFTITKEFTVTFYDNIDLVLFMWGLGIYFLWRKIFDRHATMLHHDCKWELTLFHQLLQSILSSYFIIHQTCFVSSLNFISCSSNSFNTGS